MSETRSAKPKRLKACGVRLEITAPPSQRLLFTPPHFSHPQHSLLSFLFLFFLGVALQALVELSDLLSRKHPRVAKMTRSSTKSSWPAPQLKQIRDKLRRKSRWSLLESRRKHGRSVWRPSCSRSQPPRHYMTRSRSTGSVRRRPPSFAWLPCRISIPFISMQAVKVEQPSPVFAAISRPAPFLQASRHFPSPIALNS